MKKIFFDTIKLLKKAGPVRYYGAAALVFCLMFRFSVGATGGDPTFVRMGDVNGDGVVTASDVFGLIAGLGKTESAFSGSFVSADMNADGRLSTADVLSLMRYMGGSGSEVAEAEALTLSADSLRLGLGESASLGAALAPENATVKKLIWRSTDEAVATVDENGLVSAKGFGTALIIASSGDGQASARCLISVGLVGAEFSPAEIYLYENQSPVLLTPTVYPAEAAGVSFVWQSSDWDVAGVDSFGGVTPLKEGAAVIGASFGDITAACTVHVLPEPEPAEAENAPDISQQRSLGKGVFTNYLRLSRTLDSMLDIQCRLYNVTFDASASPASPEIVADRVNPERHVSGAEKYQFLDLSVPNNMTADELNVYLKGKGILDGMGQAFIDAANEFGVSEAYLVAHACLESGNGRSQLARGVEDGGVTVYNMFGIGAYDGNALRGGAAYARAQGWTSPEAAIKGGAKWIAQNYIYRSNTRQNTLYKMRWNPLSPGFHQYATDVSWAIDQAHTIAKIIGSADCLQIFEIPVYSGEYTGYVPDVAPILKPDYSVDPSAGKEDEAAEPETSPEQSADPAAEQAAEPQTEEPPTVEPQTPETEEQKTAEPVTVEEPPSEPQTEQSDEAEPTAATEEDASAQTDETDF